MRLPAGRLAQIPFTHPLTPIGHQNNMPIMGLGGYRFGDYWRIGLPVEALVVLVATPLILWVWPL